MRRFNYLPSKFAKIFYSGLLETSATRSNLSLYISHNNGENWAYIKSICPGSSDYSSLTITNEQCISVLYEKGKTMDAPDSLTFALVYDLTERIKRCYHLNQP